MSNQDLSPEIARLLDEQKSQWHLLEANYRALDSVRVRLLDFSEFSFKVQFNPKRIKSSSAKVDKQSIKARKCFLCHENRPPQQRGINVGIDYVILCNPYPIFPQHFTIAKLAHTPQRIASSFPAMLDLAQAMQNYVVFYNGPFCGASAPDHLHFQAGNKNFMSTDSELPTLKAKAKAQKHTQNLDYFAIDDGLRKIILFESENKEEICRAFDFLHKNMLVYSEKDKEPMLNIHATMENGLWRVLIFPRGKHRPSQYFAQGDENILLSPASVDYGGVLITPLEKDFLKITPADVRDIFRQVSLSGKNFDFLIRKMEDYFSGK